MKDLPSGFACEATEPTTAAFVEIEALFHQYALIASAAALRNDVTDATVEHLRLERVRLLEAIARALGV